MDNLHFMPNNILTIFFKELTKYKNDYQQYFNYIYIYIYIYKLYYASQGPFVLASNGFRKSFSVKQAVWLALEIEFFRNYFHLIVKIKL